MKKLLALLSVMILVIGGCAVNKPLNQTIDAKLTILHTNDHHGHFWTSRRGEYGFAARKTLVDRIRKEVSAAGGNVLLVSSGDINTGTPESDLQDAEPDFKAMSAIRYDAMALGNHEFDNPPEVLAMQKKWANFPFLSANVVKKSNGKPLYDAYKIFDLNGLKVAVFGVVAGDTYLLSNPENLINVNIKDPIMVARELVPQLRKKANVVIALSHMGYYENGNHGSNSPGDVTLARTVPGIDIIVGGHSHSSFKQPVNVNDTIIVQAKDKGKYLGRLDLAINKGMVETESFRLIPVNLKKKVKQNGKTVRVFMEEEIPQDPDMVALLTPFYEKGQERLGVEIGTSKAEFMGERKIIRSKETELGNLIAHAQRIKVGADVGVMNSGGIRASLPEGKLSYRDVLKVQPFSNTICTVVLSGKELKQYLEVAANKTQGSGAFAQFDNVIIKMKGEKVTSLKIGTKTVTDSGKYKLAINSFAARGGDGYMSVIGHPTFVDTGYVDADVLREFITQNSPLDPEQFRPTGDVIK